jgi:hypothetical protein
LGIRVETLARNTVVFFADMRFVRRFRLSHFSVNSVAPAGAGRHPGSRIVTTMTVTKQTYATLPKARLEGMPPAYSLVGGVSLLPRKQLISAQGRIICFYEREGPLPIKCYATTALASDPRRGTTTGRPVLRTIRRVSPLPGPTRMLECNLFEPSALKKQFSMS